MGGVRLLEAALMDDDKLILEMLTGVECRAGVDRRDASRRESVSFDAWRPDSRHLARFPAP